MKINFQIQMHHDFETPKSSTLAEHYVKKSTLAENEPTNKSEATILPELHRMRTTFKGGKNMKETSTSCCAALQLPVLQNY